MSFGMGWKAWQISKLRNQQRCPRCSLKYDKSLHMCPHCGELDSQELAKLKYQIEQNQQANTSLGKGFVLLAILIIIGLVIMNSGH